MRRLRPATPTGLPHDLWLPRHEETRAKWIALGLALLVHVIVLSFPLPQVENPVIERGRSENVIVISKYIPPPPPIERRTVTRHRLIRKLPVPDPTPAEPEPIREPEPRLAAHEAIPDEFEILIGEPEPPPPVVEKEPEPMIAGVGEVSVPKLIPTTKVTPDYPQLALVARLEGEVLLHALIDLDGSVGDVRVLRCSHPGFGFETSAVDAVMQWRYEPAMYRDRPVPAWLTVTVEFVLTKQIVAD